MSIGSVGTSAGRLMFTPSATGAVMASVFALAVVSALSCAPSGRSLGGTDNLGKGAGADPSQTPQISGSNPAQDRAESRETVHESTYTNRTFGYKVSIPNGLRGVSPPPPLPQHGFVITLSKEDDARLSLDGSFDPLLWDSLEGAYKSSLASVGRDAESVVVEDKKSARLGNYPALSFTIKYSKKGEGKRRALSQIISKRKCPGEDPEIVYTVTLDTSEDRFLHDRVILEQILESWQMLENCI